MSDVPSKSLQGSPEEAAADSSADPATQAFIEHRELLFSIVYNMLGTVADTEDVLQDTWLSWERRNQAPDAEPIDKPRAYLVRVAVNQALARQAAISRRRETYVGPWLPEPLVSPLADTSVPDAADAADRAVRSESVSMALLVVLDSLTPLERAVFVLHEVFGYQHTETAEILGRGPAAIRQLAHRAREHVHARRPRYRTDPRVRQRVTERFVAAAAGGDLDALLEILSPDVVMVNDGGGKVQGAGLRPVHGRDNVARFFIAVASRTPEALEIGYRRVNGDPSVVLFTDGAPYAVLVLDLTPEGDQVRSIYAVGNPDKLVHVG